MRYVLRKSPDSATTSIGLLEVRAKAKGDFAVYVRESFEIAAQRKTNLERVFAAGSLHRR